MLLLALTASMLTFSIDVFARMLLPEKLLSPWLKLLAARDSASTFCSPEIRREPGVGMSRNSSLDPIVGVYAPALASSVFLTGAWDVGVAAKLPTKFDRTKE
jgi:hypothetical protein